MNTLYIVVPAYNESENINRLIDDWYPIIESHNEEGLSRLVVIDDGSKDNTYELLKNIAKDKPLLIPVTKPNGGHGATVLYGYRYAVDSGADYIFQTDSDGQTNPQEFEAFWQDREKFAAQFGNRTQRGDGQQRALVEKVLCMILRIYFKVKLEDANAPFRLMTADYLRKYMKKMPEDYNLPNAVLTALGAYYNEAIDFKVISFKPRQAGTNTINIKRIFKIGKQALVDFNNISKNL